MSPASLTGNDLLDLVDGLDQLPKACGHHRINRSRPCMVALGAAALHAPHWVVVNEWDQTEGDAASRYEEYRGEHGLPPLPLDGAGARMSRIDARGRKPVIVRDRG